MHIGVPAETLAGEKRVATVPEVVEKLRKLGFAVAVQSGAGEAANFSDDAYRAAGAEVVAVARRRMRWSVAWFSFAMRMMSSRVIGTTDARTGLTAVPWPRG